MIRKDPIRRTLHLIASAGIAISCAASLQAQTSTATNTVIAIGPSAQGMVQAGDGNFYAPSLKFFVACQNDATMLCAEIYRITPGGTMSVLHEFQPESASAAVTSANADGLWPTALIVGSDGNLYGACRYGGPGGGGTIFEIPLSGPPTIKILKSFGVTGNSLDAGFTPLSLVQGSDGSLYETNGIGIYQLAPDGSFNTLYTFQPDQTTGAYPLGVNSTSLMQASDGNFYLTLSTGPQITQADGTKGSIARFNPLTSQLNTLHAFLDNGSEGAVPIGPLVEGSDGYLYGLTSNHATYPLYAYKIAPNGELDLLHSFTGGADGDGPQSPLLLGSDGNVYGVTHLGGDTTSTTCQPTGCGTVYQLTPAGVLTTLHTFEGGTPISTVVADNPKVDGAVPEAPLVQGSDGSFYGTSLFNVIFRTALNAVPPAPVQMTLKPTTVAAGNPTTVTWKVLNGFSQTAQVCGAYIVGNATGAGTWKGALPGTLANGVYGGTAPITPTTGGTYTYAISCGGNESAQATLLVTSTTSLQLAPPGPVAGTVNQPYQLVLSVTGGTTPYAFGLAGTVPKGLTWDPSGTLIGTPLQFGDYPLGFSVQDSSKPPPPQNDAASITLHIVSGLTLLPILQKPVVGKSYTSTLITSGGLSPYTWALASGTLPDGLQLNATAGTITGTPTKPGSFTFSITAKDSEGTPDKVTTTFILDTGVAPLDITSSALLPEASVGAPYSFSPAATGGVPPYFWSLIPSAVPTDLNPPGLAMLLSGSFSGTPTQYSFGNSGFYTFYIQVSDSEVPPVSVNQYAAIKVNRTLKITSPTSLPTGTVGVPLDVPLIAAGGVPPYFWKASSTPDPQVIGLIINGNVLGYRPQVATTADVSLYVTDSEATPDATQSDLPLVFLPAPLATTTTLTSSSTAAGTGQSVTFTAQVGLSAGGAPPGQVTFYNGTASLGTATLDGNGLAILLTSFASSGVYSITAAYGGNQSYAASTSSALTETVVTPGVTAAVSPASLTVKPGSSGQLVITITPTGGYTGTINFSCGTLPAHVSCAFAPPSLTITSGGGPFTDTLTVSTSAPAVAMLLEPDRRGRRNTILAAAVFWLPGSLTAMFGLLRRRGGRVARRQSNFWMIAILCVAAAGALTSCGSSNNNARAGTYSIPITLTLAGGATQNVSATVVIE